MLATSADAPFDAADYSFEVKWDGIRCLCVVGGGRLRLFSRHGRNISALFPELMHAHQWLSVPDALFDGELCVLKDGKPHFDTVRRRNALGDPRTIAREAAEHPAVYIVFDVLRLRGEETMSLPWLARRERLVKTWKEGAGVVVAEAVHERGRALFDATRRIGLEGMVAKHHHGPYVPGRRTRHWLKIRHQKELDGVIGGYTPRNSKGLASLALGLYHEPGEHGLVYVGNVGTGLSEATRAHLLDRLRALHTDVSPFLPPAPDVVPVTPRLVCRVTYSEMTAAGRLRHAVFRGLREDKEPAECTWSTYNT